MTSHFAVDAEPALLIHGSHHKMGTVYVETTLSRLCRRFGIEYLNGTQDELAPTTELFFQNLSRFDLDTLPPFRGSHIVRDLRDVVASGYRYHLWTDEFWVVRPMTRRLKRRIDFDDLIEPEMSYHDFLNTVPQDVGIMAELRMVATGVAEVFREWDFEDPRIIEIRFEDLVADRGASFERMFRHYGLKKKLVSEGVGIARARSIESMQRLPEADRPPHAQGGGGSGKWRTMFTDDHIAAFKELMNDVLVQTGYERDDAW